MKKVIQLVNGVMKPFLKMFGVVEGNGLSPFLKDFESPDELADAIEQFFKRPKRDPRDSSTGSVEEDEEDSLDDNNDNSNYMNDTSGMALSADYVKGKILEIMAMDNEDDDIEMLDADEGKFLCFSYTSL